MVCLDRPDPLFGRDIHIAARYLAGAPFGMKVVCQLLHPLLTASPKPPNGKIIETLGDPGRPDVAIRAIIRQYELADIFPPAVMEEAERYPVNPPPEEIGRELAAGRIDLRELRLITIDGEDARDLDDAVSIERLDEQCFRLGVHLADVSHYVPENSLLDLDARRRGTSVYLSDRVLPMLPPRLSNGLCSLNPYADRLALSVFLIIDAKGETLEGHIAKTVIRSAARATYQEVYIALTEGRTEPDRYPEFLDDLRQMRQLADYLQKRSRHLGESFSGRISGFNTAGIIVQLENTVEGIVLYRGLDGYIAFDEKRMQARNESGGRVYSLGDEVDVQVARADATARQIDFALIAHHSRQIGGHGRQIGGHSRHIGGHSRHIGGHNRKADGKNRRRKRIRS